ncbi:YbaK/prolyl-tRNA synthetase associated domain-containing protein [Pseudomonas hunanensis]|uniref:YbaK/prolyl-tRNA synthetase associated domain-containing protein n=1 Tax=Pseudomonas hunanensis TaxID=1247546 RepID=UPI0030D8AEFC
MSPHALLLETLETNACRFRLVEHPSAGKSVEVALARGTEVGQGAKALICSSTHTDGSVQFVLAVLPADRKLSTSQLAEHLGAKKIRLVSADKANELTGCVVGAIPPFSFNEELKLVADPELFERYSEIAFNAGRLDRSIILNSDDYLRVARPVLTKIAEQ